jgi:hypothetical protein
MSVPPIHTLLEDTVNNFGIIYYIQSIEKIREIENDSLYFKEKSSKFI